MLLAKLSSLLLTQLCSVQSLVVLLLLIMSNYDYSDIGDASRRDSKCATWRGCVHQLHSTGDHN